MTRAPVLDGMMYGELRHALNLGPAGASRSTQNDLDFGTTTGFTIPPSAAASAPVSSPDAFHEALANSMSASAPSIDMLREEIVSSSKRALRATIDARKNSPERRVAERRLRIAVSQKQGAPDAKAQAQVQSS